MSRRAAPILLSPEERTTLGAWAQSRIVAVRLAQRARMILLAAKGVQSQRIARQMGISRPTVQLWRERFLARRTEGLEKDAPRPVGSRNYSGASSVQQGAISDEPI